MIAITTITCTRCSQPFTKTGKSQKYCQTCASLLRTERDKEYWQRRKNGETITRTCADCGAVLTSPTAKRCQPCAKAHQAQQAKEWHKSKTGDTSPAICADCGTALEHGNAKRCPDCQKRHNAEQVREWHRNGGKAEEKTISCYRCGKPTPYSNNKKYCADCAVQINREMSRSRKRLYIEEGVKIRNCVDCGEPLKSKYARRCSTCDRAHRRLYKSAWYQEKGKAAPPKPKPEPMPAPVLSGSYLDHQLDLLAAAILGQAWRDCRQSWQDGEYIPANERAKAKLWWHENARDWVDALGLDIALPGV